MDKKKQTKKPGEAKLVALGAGLAGLAATAYFFLGPEGKNNQKQFKAWAVKMKGDVLEKLEQAKEVNEPAYHKIIDTVAAKHEKFKKAAPADIKTLAKDLKKHWGVISQPAVKKTVAKKATPKKAVKPAKKTVKAQAKK